MEYNIYINEKKIENMHLDAINEYIKRLSTEVKVNIYSGKLAHKALKSHKDDYLYCIESGLSSFDSVELSNDIYTNALSGFNRFGFTIGYTYGSISHLCNHTKVLCLTNMNISTGMLSVVLLEQLYRAYTIHIGKTYHK